MDSPAHKTVGFNCLRCAWGQKSPAFSSILASKSSDASQFINARCSKSIRLQADVCYVFCFVLGTNYLSLDRSLHSLTTPGFVPNFPVHSNESLHRNLRCTVTRCHGVDYSLVLLLLPVFRRYKSRGNWESFRLSLSDLFSVTTWPGTLLYVTVRTDGWIWHSLRCVHCLANSLHCQVLNVAFFRDFSVRKNVNGMKR